MTSPSMMLSPWMSRKKSWPPRRTASTRQRPSRDWLAFVKTARARQKIRNWIQREESASSINLGKELFERVKQGQIGDLVTLRAYRLSGTGGVTAARP